MFFVFEMLVETLFAEDLVIGTGLAYSRCRAAGHNGLYKSVTMTMYKHDKHVYAVTRGLTVVLTLDEAIVS